MKTLTLGWKYLIITVSGKGAPLGQFGLSGHSRSKSQCLRQWDTLDMGWRVRKHKHTWSDGWAESPRGGQGPLATGWVVAQGVWKAKGISGPRGPTWTTAHGWEGISPTLTTEQVSSPGEGCCLGWASGSSRPSLPSPSAGFQNSTCSFFSGDPKVSL